MMNKPEVLVALLHESILSRATSRNKTSGDSTEIPSSSAPNRSGTIQSTLSVIHVDTAALVARNAPQNLSRYESNQLVLDSLRAAITFAVTSPSHSPAERAAHLNECLDSFTSSCTLGQKEFDRVLSETLPAIGMAALEYEIFRWDPIWEEDYGTLELSVTHSEIGTGLEAVKFMIDHWIPQSTDHTHWRKLMDLVRRACLYRTRGVSDHEILQLDEDVANKLLQRISRVVLARLSNTNDDLVVTSPGDITISCSQAEYTISLTSSQNIVAKKGKSTTLRPISGHLSDGDEFTALISLPHFDASLRDVAIHAASLHHPRRPNNLPTEHPSSPATRHRSTSSLLSDNQNHHLTRRQTHKINLDRLRRNDLQRLRYDHHLSSARLRVKPTSSPAQISPPVYPEAPQILETSFNSAALRVEFIGGARLWALDVGKRTMTLAVIGGVSGRDSRHEQATSSNEDTLVVYPEIRIVPLLQTGIEHVFTFTPIEIRHAKTHTTSRSISDYVSSTPAFSGRQHEELLGSINSFDDHRLLQDDGALLLELRVRFKKAASISRACNVIARTESDSTTSRRASGPSGSENAGEPSYGEERSETSFSSYDELSIPDMLSRVSSETDSWISIRNNQEAISHSSDNET